MERSDNLFYVILCFLECKNEVLHTTKEDILRAADLIEKLVANAGVCIVGGKAQLDAAKDKIDSIIEI